MLKIKRLRWVLTLAVLAGLLGLGAPSLGQDIDPDGWGEIRGPGLVVYTNASPERGLEMTLALERFRAVFARLAPAIELRSPAPTTVLAFRNAEDFAPYKTRQDRGNSRILGQFISHPDGNYLILDAGNHMAGSFAVIVHEFVHYFVRHNFPGVPLWFNEGLAEYYSTFETTADGVVLGLPVERHVALLKRDGEFSLSELLGADTRSSSYHRPDQVGHFYALSWLLVHHLLSSGELDATADFLARTVSGEDPEDAFEEAFDRRLSDLEEDLENYFSADELPSAVLTLEGLPGGDDLRARALPPADVLYHLGDLLAHTGRADDAEQHFAVALDFEPNHADAMAGRALVRDFSNRFDEAEILYRDALAAGPRHPSSHLYYGRHLLLRAQATAGKGRLGILNDARRQLRDALEAMPDYGEAWVLLGKSYLLDSDDLGDGIRAFQEARDLLPGRFDILGDLAHLHARQGQGDMAHRLVDELAIFTDAETASKARDEVERLLLLHAADLAFEEGEAERGLELFDQAIEYARDPRVQQAMEEQLEGLQERFEASGG